MEFWRDMLLLYFAAYAILIVCTGNTNGCVFPGNSHGAARLTVDEIAISNNNTQVTVRLISFNT